MDKFVSKLSLYDILSMIIPGGTILLFLSRYFGYYWKADTTWLDVPAFYVIALMLAYIVGLVDHIISSEMWKMFRNNPLLIQKGHDMMLSETNEGTIPKSTGHIKDCICMKFLVYAPMIVCFCFAVIIVVLYSLQKNMAYCCLFYVGLILLVMTIALLIFLADKESSNHSLEARKLMSIYYDAYYYLDNKGKLGAVTIIEGQIAFLEGMIIPLFLFTLLPDRYWNTNSLAIIYGIKFLILLLCVSINYAVYKRAIKVHYLVWCNEHYYKKLK